MAVPYESRMQIAANVPLKPDGRHYPTRVVEEPGVCISCKRNATHSSLDIGGRLAVCEK
jgi:hypothetical protein